MARAYKNLTLEQLRSFAHVVRLGSYAAAARSLFLTSPAVWEQLRALERHYGVRLVVRRGNAVEPTAEGRQLMELVEPLLAGLDASADVIRQKAGSLPAEIKLVTNLRVLGDEISNAMRQFRQRHDTVVVRLSFTDIDQVEPQVLSGGADVAFTLEPRPDNPASPSVVYEPAGELDYLLVVPQGHRLAAGRAPSLEAIVRHPLVLGQADTYSRRRSEEVLYRHNLVGRVRLAVETSSDEYTLACVRAGLGVGITVGSGQGPLYRRLRARSLSRYFGTARLGFLWKRGAAVPPLSRELADFVAAACQRAT